MPSAHKPNSQTTLTIASRLSELRRLLRLADDFGAVHKVPGPVWYCARLALEEIVTNAMKHGRSKNAGPIVIRLARNARELTLRIEDEAARFNPLEHAHAAAYGSLKEKARGGHGLLLVKNLMDEFKYRRYRRKNIVTLKKRLI